MKKCKDCGKELSLQSKRITVRCRSCNAKHLWSTGKIGKEISGANNHNYKGGKYKNSRGYIIVLSPDHPNATVKDYVLEHRLVMEKKLGRYLNPSELVHHLNNIKTDNRPENLSLKTRHTHDTRSVLRAGQERIRLLEKRVRELEEDVRTLTLGTEKEEVNVAVEKTVDRLKKG
jgi:hypothetical protein